MQAVVVAQIPDGAGDVVTALHLASNKLSQSELHRHERCRCTYLGIPFLEAQPIHDHPNALGVIRIGEVNELLECDLALEQDIDQGSDLV